VKGNVELCTKSSSTMQSEQLIQSLIEQTRRIINQAEQLKTLDNPTLNWKEHETSWSILECLEHLNLYGDFYLPEIETKIKASASKSELEFRPGLLGNYFSQSMLPKERLNKMKTFKDKNPLNSSLDRTTIDRFLAQQMRLLQLLNESREVSLNKVKVPTTLTKLIQLKLGDAFPFVINHNIRHFKQIENVQKAMKEV
jgi:hypothetical protein